MRHIIRVTALSTSLALAALAAGCGGSSATEGPAVTASGATRAPVAVASHGQVKMFAEALSEVPLQAEQRAEIEQLAADAEARHVQAKAVHASVMLALADQIDKGTIDRAALQPQVDAAAAAFQQSRPADRAALERLHAILDAGQRAAFVDAVESKMQAHKGHAMHGQRMQEWVTDLKLTDAQQDQIRAAMKAAFVAQHAENAEAKTAKGAHPHEGKQVLEAFKGDRFVMDEVAPMHDAQTGANKMADHLVRLAEVALPVLTAEQRTLASAKLRARAADPNAETE